MPEDPEKARLRRHAETWRRAEAELRPIRERELAAVDTRLAVRQLFGDNTLVQTAPRLHDSGLVEQQAWFAKLRGRRGNPMTGGGP